MICPFIVPWIYIYKNRKIQKHLEQKSVFREVGHCKYDFLQIYFLRHYFTEVAPLPKLQFTTKNKFELYICS